MTRLAEEPDIIDLAKKLGVGAADDPVVAILDFCRNRIDRWVAEAGGVGSIEHLERLVTEKLQMVFEEIRNDGDFDRIKQVYAVGKRDSVFATMRLRFDDLANPTYGALVRRKNVAADAPDRYVAVIDCRGDKLARRFFTRWHEIAHRLTTDADPDEPVYRSEHDPIEQMMDRIASHVGFYEPLLRTRRSIGRCEGQGSSRSMPSRTSAARRSRTPASSPRCSPATADTTEPAVYVEASPALKAKHKRAIKQGAQWLFDDLRPVPSCGRSRSSRMTQRTNTGSSSHRTCVSPSAR